MRLTAMTDYAMRLLMKITHRLAQKGWLETVRGKNGGMRLARPAQEMRLGSIVRDTENDMALIECFLPDSRCALTGRCRLTHIIDQALQDFLLRLDQYTLADILAQPGDGLALPACAEEDQTISQRTVIGWARKV